MAYFWSCTYITFKLVSHMHALGSSILVEVLKIKDNHIV